MAKGASSAKKSNFFMVSRFWLFIDTGFPNLLSMNEI